MTSVFSIFVYYIGACWRSKSHQHALSKKRVCTSTSVDPETLALLSESRNSTTASWGADPSINLWTPVWDDLDDKAKVVRSDDTVQTSSLMWETQKLTLPVLSNSRSKKTPPRDDESRYVSATDLRRHQLMEHRRELLKERKRAVRTIKKIDETLRSIERDCEASIEIPFLDHRDTCNTDSPRSDRSTTSTVQSTPPSIRMRSAVFQEERLVQGAKTRDQLLIAVQNLLWIVVFPSHRQEGLFTGMTLNGTIPHGIGILHFHCGDTYYGHFTYGLMQGANGRYTFVSGKRYKGDFVKNVKHGRGEEVSHQGSRYVGQYENGRAHGFGVQYDSNGSVIHLGQWRDGKPWNKKVDLRQTIMADSGNADVSNRIGNLEAEAYTQKPHVGWAKSLTVGSSKRGSGFEAGNHDTEELDDSQTSGGNNSSDDQVSMNRDERAIISLAVSVGSVLPSHTTTTSIPPLAMDIPNNDDELGLSWSSSDSTNSDERVRSIYE